MTGVTSGHWAGKYVAVCDPEPAASEIGKRELEPGEPRRRELLTPDEAGSYAIRGIERYDLREQEEFARALDGTKPAPGRLVQRLDRTDSFYYLVPMVRDERPSAVVSVGALDARYHQASIVPEDGGWDLSSLDRDAVYRRVVGQRLPVDERSRTPIRPEAVCIYPALVWKPCRESLSPNYPFAMITVGDQRFYLRSDGEIFSQLHDLDAGI
jgi:hypothetical protein